MLSPGRALSPDDSRISEDYRLAWRKPERPTMADYLKRGQDQSARANLFWHLLETDLENRRHRGEQPVIEDYQEYALEFPDVLLEFLACTTGEIHPPSSRDTWALGSYRIQKELGRGGMGVVYLALDPALQRSVAIKVMHPKHADDPDARRRFLREARAAAAVEHDNIVPIYLIVEDGEQPYFVMPRLRGISLQERLEHKEPLSLAEVLWIGREVATGLAMAHAHRLIHRDIKPSNIWLEAGMEDETENQDGDRAGSKKEPVSYRKVKILDFGLACQQTIREEPKEPLTLPGTVIGTPEFMSPEQAKGLTVDFRADLYSLGIMLYRMIAGRFPFVVTTRLGYLEAHAGQTPIDIRTVKPDLPPELATTIMQLLEKDPDQRIASARALKDKLIQFLPAEGPLSPSLPKSAAAPEHSTPLIVKREDSAQSTRTLSSPTRMRWAAGAFGVLLIAAGLFAWGGTVVWSRLYSSDGRSGLEDESDQPADPGKTMAPKPAFVPLCNGANSKGWSLEGPHTTPLTFTGGVLSTQNKGGVGFVDTLLTDRLDFTDFHLRVRVKLAGGRPVGAVLVRVDPSPVTFGGMRGYRIEFASPIGGEKHRGSVRLGLGSRARAPFTLSQAQTDVAIDTWHQVEVIAIRNRITVRVNNKEVIDYRDEGRTFRRGAVALEFLPSTINHYRDVEIMELPSSAKSTNGTRERWVHRDRAKDQRNEFWGIYQHAKGKEWVESVTIPGNPGSFQRFLLTEVNRTEKYIELERMDGGRKVVTRLFKAYMETGPSTAGLRRGYFGNWEN